MGLVTAASLAVVLLADSVSCFSVSSSARLNVRTKYGNSNPLRSLETASSDLDTEVKDDGTEKRRILGSQELLMLPRQYSPNPDVTFPQMNHVSCTVLSGTPSENVLRQAIDEAIATHPLLRCRVEGDGEPDKRIDLFQMVRQGEPNPCTFVAPQESFSSTDVLRTITVVGDDRAAIDQSWEESFKKDLDDGSWCDTDGGPLWKLEWHKPKEACPTKPSALLLSFNHAISDQSSANMLIDEILGNVAQIEKEGKVTKAAVEQDMPMALEDSVLGENSRFSDIQIEGFNAGTLKYVAGKAAEGFKSPVILPDSDSTEGGGGLLGALTIISGNAAGGENEESEERRSTVQFRKLSEKATSALLKKCRENEVAVTNALTAAVTLTASDFIDNGLGSEDKSRNYKVLQSLDMRRFGKQIDKGETVACMAGSMDLIHGPVADKSGENLRNDPSPEHLETFWSLAREGKEQTTAFIGSDGPSDAVRVFDFAMTISDMNNLVDLTAKSKGSQGRAYSAGVSNVGVYDRQAAVQWEGQKERETLQVSLAFKTNVLVKEKLTA